ncbi:hypothetical protein BDW74DRAFT_154357 [Aspergillus multicolor]|uniref:uncharacterized protein n=1 Tax=Aspergillus multicolor TaxID=41759 RepID=UPI003CCDF086
MKLCSCLPAALNGLVGHGHGLYKLGCILLLVRSSFLFPLHQHPSFFLSGQTAASAQSPLQRALLNKHHSTSTKLMSDNKRRGRQCSYPSMPKLLQGRDRRPWAGDTEAGVLFAAADCIRCRPWLLVFMRTDGCDWSGSSRSHSVSLQTSYPQSTFP